jgi:hypothetical protein
MPAATFPTRLGFAKSIESFFFSVALLPEFEKATIDPHLKTNGKK